MTEAAQPTPTEVASAPAAARMPGAGWPARLLLAAIAIVVFGPVIYYEAGPAEAAKWHLGAAREHDLSGREDQALTSYDSAIQWHPDLWLIYQERARFHASRERHEKSLADWDRSLECFPFEARTRTGQRRFILERGVELLYLDRYDDALDDAKRLVDMSRTQFVSERVTALNWIAYMRAVANRDLETALTEIDEVFSLLKKNRLSRDQPSLIDTRAFVLYRLNQLDEARQEMDRALALQRAASARYVASDDRRRQAFDSREGERDLVNEAKTLAVMHYHRGLIYEALGDEAKANRDYKVVRDLGFEPSPELF